MSNVPERNFPETLPNTPWPGAWHWGVDFAEGSTRVIAVRLGGGDIKYGTNWIGPVELTDENAKRLSDWAQATLNCFGGYVHLFPADGDASIDLRSSVWLEDDDSQPPVSSA